MREITVIWDECFKWEGALSERDLPKMDGIGLYQIYGYHIIFGARFSALYWKDSNGL